MITFKPTTSTSCDFGSIFANCAACTLPQIPIQPTQQFTPDLRHDVIVQNVQHKFIVVVVLVVAGAFLDGIIGAAVVGIIGRAFASDHRVRVGQRVRPGQALFLRRRVIVIAELFGVATDSAVVVALPIVSVVPAASASGVFRGVAIRAEAQVPLGHIVRQLHADLIGSDFVPGMGFGKIREGKHSLVTYEAFEEKGMGDIERFKNV